MDQRLQVSDKTMDTIMAAARRLNDIGSAVKLSRDAGQPKIAFVTFKDPAALEIALLLSGAAIVDQIGVTMVDNSVSMGQEIASSNSEANSTTGTGRVYVSKAQDVVSSMLAKVLAIRQDAMNKGRAFDEQHQLTANASARV